MKFTGRVFLKFSGIAAVAGVVFSGSVFAGSQDDVLADRTTESFRQLVGSEFYTKNQ